LIGGRNQSYLAFRYDFRRGLDEQEEYFQNLTQLVLETYEQNNQTKVVLVTHSMGGSFRLLRLIAF
jgi:alpha-beta hydrolase superfamily lysophospholipase